MKAKDLMIGDWVIDTEFDRNSSARVEIAEPSRVWLDKGKEYTPIGYIEPIPLTEEIIDANFKDISEPHQKIYGGRWIYYTDYVEVEIVEYTDGIWQVVVDEIEMSGLPTWKMYVSYVHELQHALRLCGIEKEIEL